MAIKKTTINYADMTVLGNFNPAILRPEFLEEYCAIDRGKLKKASPINIPVVSELEYENLRWYMDFGRMTVQCLNMDQIEDFPCPGMARRYLEVLEHTPITRAGINVNADFEISDVDAMWGLIRESARLYAILENLRAKSPSTEFKSRLTREDFQPVETTIRYQSQEDAKVMIKIRQKGTQSLVRGEFNCEVHGLADNGEPFVSMVENHKDITRLFMSFMKAVCGG